jgi:hypothetical protein
LGLDFLGQLPVIAHDTLANFPFLWHLASTWDMASPLQRTNCAGEKPK